MPVFTVKGPDGKTHKVNAPEGATQQDAIAYVASSKYGISQEQPTERVNKPEERRTALDKASRFLESGGRGAIKGGAALLDLPAVVSNWVGDKFGDALVAAGVPEHIAHPEQERKYLSQTDVLRNLGGELKDATAFEKAAHTFSEWAVPGGAMSKMLKAPAGLDVVSGLTAAGGEALAGETGEVVGGMTPIVLSLGKSLLMNKLPHTGSSEDRAYQFIMDNAEDPAKALENLKAATARGEKGTLADLTGDRALYNIEAYANKGSSAAHAIDEQKLAREAQIVEDVEGVMPRGDAAPAQQTAADIVENRAQTIRTAETERLNRAAQEAAERQAASEGRIAGFEEDIARAEGMELAAERGAQGAEEAAAAARADATIDAPAADVSADLSTALRESAADFAELERRPAWKEFDELEPIPSGGFGEKAILTPVRKRFPNYTYNAARNKYSEIFKQLGDDFDGRFDSYDVGWGNKLYPKDAHALYQKLKSVTKTAKNKGEYGPEETLLDTVADNIDKALKDSDVSVAYKKAKDVYEKEMQVYKPGRLGEAVRADDVNVAAKGIIPKGAEGTTVGGQFQTLVNDLRARGKTELADRVETAFQNRIRQEVGDVGADKFLSQYGDLTDYMPEELVNKIRLASETEEVAKGARQGLERARTKAAQEKTAAERGIGREETTVQAKIQTDLARQEGKARSTATQRQKGLEGRITAKYAKAPSDTIAGLLKNEKGAPQLKRLNDIMVQRGQGEAFKSNVREVLSSTLFPTKGGTKTATPASIDAFLKQQKQLVASGVLSVDEADSILKTLDRTKTQIVRQKAAMQKMDDMGNELDNLLASALAAGGMGVFKTNSLVIAGAMRRAIRAKLKKSTNPDIDAIEGFLKDPESVLRHVPSSKDPKKYTDNLLKLLFRKQIADSDREEE